MMTKPTELTLPRGGTVGLRPVTPEDDEFLLSVYADTREEELAQVQWEPGQREAFLRMQFDAQRSEYDARFSDPDYQIILVDGQPAGRLWVGRSEKEIRLLDIALLTEFQNRSVGTLLVQDLINEARAAGKPLRHMVFVLNTNALRFYARLGFVLFEEVGAYHHMEWKSE